MKPPRQPGPVRPSSHPASPTTSSTFFPFNLCTHREAASPRFRVARDALSLHDPGGPGVLGPHGSPLLDLPVDMRERLLSEGEDVRGTLSAIREALRTARTAVG